MRPMIIGMNNPLSTAPEHALYPLPQGCTGNRLWVMLAERTDASMRDYVDAFERTNLVVGEWNARAARLRALDLLPGLGRRTVLLLGRAVCTAFDLGLSPLEDTWVGETHLCHVPHPSGLNRWYNVPGNRDEVCDLMAVVYRASLG